MPGPTAPTDVLPGAEPFAFPGSGPDGRTGVLLVHGFTGTPMSMRPWGEHLAEAGFAVRCPLLPGHGTRWQDCNLSSHGQWTTAVDEAFDALAADCDRVFVAGLSMGGTLATRFAEVRPDDLAGLLLVNPSFFTTRLDANQPANSRPGDYSTLLDYYATAGAQLLSVRVNGKPTTAAAYPLDGRPMYRLQVQLRRGATQTIELHLQEPPGSGSPVIWRQPGVTPMSVTAYSQPCG